MPIWEMNPFSDENFPQTPQVYLTQLDQELESMDGRKVYILEERQRTVSEIKRLGGDAEDSYEKVWEELDSIEARKERLLHILAGISYGETDADT